MFSTVSSYVRNFMKNEYVHMAGRFVVSAGSCVSRRSSAVFARIKGSSYITAVTSRIESKRASLCMKMFGTKTFEIYIGSEDCIIRLF